MIYWKDFLFDEVVGAVQVLPNFREGNDRQSVKEDANLIQETRQDLRPARLARKAASSERLESEKQGMEAYLCGRSVSREQGGA